MPPDQPTTQSPKCRWFHLTPARLLIISLLVEGILMMSDRFQWFAFNKHEGWTVLIAVAAVGFFLLGMLLWFAVACLFRWRFQFSIRSLLILTIAVAIPFSWLAMEMKRSKEQMKAVEALHELGGDIFFDSGQTPYKWPTFGTLPSGPAWLRNILGDDFFITVEVVNLDSAKLTDYDLKHLEGMKHLKQIYLSSTQVTDGGVAELQKALPNCKISR